MVHDLLPPLQCLRAFLAVAEQRNFTRAGEVLGLTQTAVSHQIAKLEDWAGTPLFRRAPSGVTLTAAGARLHPQVEAGLAALRAGFAELREEPEVAEISVATTPELGTQWLGPRLERYLTLVPDVRIRMGVGHRRPDLRTSSDDMSVWPAPGGRGLVSYPLGLEEEFVVCAPEVSERLPERHGLWAAPLLRHAGSRQTVLDWERWYDQVVPDDPRVLPFEDCTFGPTYETFAEMIAACIEGEGLALVRTSLVHDEIERGRLVRAFSEIAPSDLQYHVTLSPEAARRPEVVAFADWLRREAG
ncbi:LysR family transcriptional regulator [Histidinibacterium aquaticum]|uniref:LysR family transcriptional regulator n=1 Tax=Histidinibacterium aquaticum TaxID=2613962 RepID=A0A5J5GSF8_9RHOB|nr:LysR family transcriptional regulator [Histidinibacterium aquaticum]KAA9010282.1 LysR family transcriptional regulator [Histidinibacterium aquaticum]